MKAAITLTPKTMKIDMSANDYAKYNVSVQQWRLDGSVADFRPGFPRITTEQDISLERLEPGRYFHVSHR